VTSINAWPMAGRPWASDLMRKKNRLRANADFQRIRREGSAWTHPLLVLSALPNDMGHSRFGFIVGRRIGRAVKRNKTKRRMREAVRTRVQKGEIIEGWDIVFIARRPIRDASFQQVDQAIGLLLRRAGLVSDIS
jgi:ribonuclease P protein component